MRYLNFEIKNYRAIEKPVKIDVSRAPLIPLVGINECGKTTILQAIYCFDYINDAEYGGKHLKDTKNLYKTSEKEDPTIVAEVETKYSRLTELYKDFIDEHNNEEEDNEEETGQSEETGDEEEDEDDGPSYPNKFPISKDDFNGTISIKRNLATKKYEILEIEIDQEYDKDFHNSFSRLLLRKMPYILYNDDFMDRPPNHIVIPNERPANMSGWLSIYERLFNATSDDYSLFQLIKEKDSRRRDAILSDVQERLNKTLAKAWKTFLLSSHGAINVKLSLIPHTDPDKKSQNKLEIKIVERLDSRERFFDVIDRSKGFLWFFNFVMKLEFNPKVLNGSKDTLYLLDEPGSYLHYSAQEKLCTKLVDISKKHGTVLYCTHSHTLLNPELIPLNNIYLVEKGKQKNIKAQPLPLVKTNAESSTAYQPIFEALQMSAFNIEHSKLPVIAVEGIYDKYVIELFVDLKEKVFLLPGTSANSIIKNIQFLNGFNRMYVAIWDNDDEGKLQYEKAKSYFGEFESKKFDRLPSRKDGKSRRMEQMFNQEDLDFIRVELGLEQDISYERIVANLYFSKKEKRKKIVQGITDSSKSNFSALKAIIEKRLKCALELEQLQEQ
jgi:predicted ATP-dependent endonuclease of OLD family